MSGVTAECVLSRVNPGILHFNSYLFLFPTPSPHPPPNPDFCTSVLTLTGFWEYRPVVFTAGLCTAELRNPRATYFVFYRVYTVYVLCIYCVCTCNVSIWYMIYFVNCSWVDTRWQQYSTHLHTNSIQNDTKQTIHRTTQKCWKSAGRAPSLRVTSRHLAYNWGKSREKPQTGKNMIWYMIYLLTAVGLTPGASSTVHIYTQTIHRTTQFTN